MIKLVFTHNKYNMTFTQLEIFALIAVILLSGMAMGLEAKKPRKRKQTVPKEEVWTAISGTYSFTNNEFTIMIEYFHDEFRAYINGPGYEDDGAFDGSVDEKTGLITIVDDDNKVIFTGKMYRGGNQLRGELNGNAITLEGMCGA